MRGMHGANPCLEFLFEVWPAHALIASSRLNPKAKAQRRTVGCQVGQIGRGAEGRISVGRVH